MVTDSCINPSGILLYNTQNIDEATLKAQFSIRKKEYEQIWQDIRTNTMQYPATHYLIQGVRGAGKTTLLTRLSYAVSGEESLNPWLIPILFNEEEYGIFSLFTFWLRIAEKLALHDANRYETLYTQLMQLSNEQENQAWALIRKTLIHHGQKIIVFIDNMAELFDGFSDNENAQLREVLSLHPEIRIVGGSSVILDAHFDGTAPFYQFFKLVNLKAISEAEMHELLRTLARHTSKEAIERIEEIITQHPERIEAVRRLTDGVPRTIVLLFQIIMEGAKDSSFTYLEETIDKTTPLYKHRMDDLTRQQQVIVNAIAMNWDAMNVKEIAEQTRLPSKTISAQLTVLQKRWMVDKVETNTKNHLYLLKERFFNIWYLMRYGTQRDKRRVLWLTKFLESWYGEKELSLKLVEALGTLLDKDAKSKDLLINALLASDKIDYDIRRDMAEKYRELARKPVVGFSNEQQKILRLEIEQIIKTKDDKNIYQFLQNHGDRLTLIDLVTYYHQLYELGSNYFKPQEFFLKISPIGYVEAVHLFTTIYARALVGYKQAVIDVFEANLKEFSEDVSVNTLLFFSLYLEFCLWDNQFERVKNIFDILDKQNIFTLIEGRTGIRSTSEVKEIFFESIILLLLAKKQYEMAYHLFYQFKLIQLLKPLYFATVYYLPDERHQEFLRMGYELHETLMEIFAVVEEYQIKYA